MPVMRGPRPKSGSIDYYLEGGGSRRGTRASTRASSLLASSEGERGNSADTGRGPRRLRPRVSHMYSQSTQYEDKDELQESDGDGGDPSFSFVQSDIVQTKRRKLRKLSRRIRTSTAGRLQHDDSDIEFESRRSSRATRTHKVMTDSYVDDEDDIYYVEEKPLGAPKVVGVREVFQSSIPPEFKEAHRPICTTCGRGDDHNKGAMIPCQGCSNSYHKLCLGVRSTRDHVVTKVMPDAFVLQCRFCIGIYKKKDERAPNHGVCQWCHLKGRSCNPFSERKTAKQEETLRLENGGVDPVTPIEPNFINNAENVLFRCSRCYRAWHYEHLPHPTKARDPAINDPLNLRKHRREEYQITWFCKECQETEEEKVDKIVAWRPVNRQSYQGQDITKYGEDSLEYLIKWEKKSYNHCMWMPGAWVFGVVKPAMRRAFVKRTFGEAPEEGLDTERNVDSLLRWTEKEAIHDVWITPDIILDVHYAPRSREDEKRYRAMSRKDKFEDDLNRVFHVIKIYVKFEGLGYDDAVWDTPPTPDMESIYDAYLDAYREYLNGKHFQPELWRDMNNRVENFRQLDFESAIRVKGQPKGLKRGKLMEYQIEGLNWILYNYRHERSVILADEMGLGKTIQVVALLASMIQDQPRIWPFLIVVPNATCPNWRREIKKWAPELRVVAYYGGKTPQKLALEYELFPNGSRELKAHVVIMSYDSVKDNDTRLRFHGTKWAGLIVDEAQALKNDENGIYRALNALRIPFKLLLTGTPLQNNKRELFNLLQFIDPSLKAEQLDEKFAQLTSENLAELHELIRPYFLRRTKAMVLTFLPPMAQIIVPVSMSVLQEKLCRSIMERNPELIRSIFIRGKMKASERGSLSNILMQLRKCLCHPFIYSQAIEDRTASPELTRRNLVEASPKLMLLEIMLPKLKERGHRVLMFSQFLDQLTILEDFLAGMNVKFERLDGSQSSLEKQKKIDAFNAPDSDIFVMLLSTRAGGVGINLATADTVIILDPDWNPHQDIQALSRAHRIGQRKKVLCFQLVTVDSAEEKILQIGRKKLALDHVLIESMDNDPEQSNDVESVLKYGAAALFGEGNKKEAITYDSAAVDKLLDRSAVEETKTNEEKSAESAFAFARVWANDKGALADDLQVSDQNVNASVWDEILQQREEEAKREAERNREILGRGGRRRGTANYSGHRFEFDDGQDAAAPESDHGDGDGDGDFVGSDKSDGETSEDEEAATPATGESIVTESNVRKAGTKASQEPEAHPPTSASRKDGSRKDSGKDGDRKDSRKDADRKDSRKDGDRKDSRKGKGGQDQADAAKTVTPVPVPKPWEHHSSGEVARHTKQDSRSRLSSREQSVPMSAGAGSAGHLNGGDDPNRRTTDFSGIPIHTAAHANGIQSDYGVQPVSITRSAVAGAEPASVPGYTDLTLLSSPPPGLADPVPPRRPAPFNNVCLVCEYSHPSDWECPEMSSQIHLRLAMDRLRSRPRASAEELMQGWLFLQAKLKRVTGLVPLPLTHFRNS
ncbi:hypothetical protein N656DRAFT_611577 [Canariomyces notabilis]|uniref:Chromatin remodeling factor mit1 n=1 Tax=Canariomyces notabilis TaxID=2074819 RepID=A0AAN6YU04_9PEZI|nr:hypothetical protein N656DRAFT_611577 [Canariomyces arenarius]